MRRDAAAASADAGDCGIYGDGRATISDLAEFLQERNNSVVGLVERAADSGLVRRRAGKTDRRQVVVTLTSRGKEILATLTELHHDEVRRVQGGIFDAAANETGARQLEKLARARERRGSNG